MTSRRLPVVVAAVLLAAALALAVTGVSLLPLIAVAGLVWTIVLAHRWGGGLGIAGGVLGTALLALGSLIAFPPTGLPLFGASVVLWAVVGAGGVVVLARTGTPPTAVRWRAAAWRWAPPLLGAGIWTVAMLVSLAIDSASRYSWVMMGDSANNLLFARETVYSDGVVLGANANPVPLPAALIALAMSAGRSSTAVADLLRHDISSFALVWALLIALTCYLAGAAAAVVVDRSRKWVVMVAGAGASLIPLSWFVTGYPIEYGFFNTHLALPIVFLSWIAANSAARNPAIAIAALFAASTLILAVWSPLVLIPVLLGMLVVVRHWRALIATRGPRLVILAVGALQLLAFGLVATLPSLLAQGGFLTGGGGVIAFPTVILLGAALGTLAVAVFAVLRKSAGPGLALAAVFAAGVIGVGTLLFLNRAQPSPWTYYPTKLAWLMTIIFGVLALGTLLAALPPVRKAALTVIALVLTVATAGSLYAAAKSIPFYGWQDPLPRIFADDFSADDAVAEKIFALSDPAHPHLLWQSDDPLEGSINFWLLQLRADSTSERSELRVYAYAHGDTINDLCDIAEAMGPPVLVQTANAALVAEAAEACADAVTVEVRDP